PVDRVGRCGRLAEGLDRLADGRIGCGSGGGVPGPGELLRREAVELVRDVAHVHALHALGPACREVLSGQRSRTSEVRMAKDDGGQTRASRRAQEAEEVEATESSDVAERQEKLSEDVDDILDEIDSVLEENAEDFVRSYVQKGGE